MQPCDTREKLEFASRVLMGDVDEATNWFNECLRQQAECMKKRVRERRIGMINNVIVSDNM